MSALRIGINALYLLPGEVGGTEIYLRCLLDALAGLESPHEFFLYANRESSRDLCPAAPRWHFRPLPVRARFRPARLLQEQFFLPGRLKRDGIDVLFNPGFTAPAFPGCPQVTVFHDLQHARHPEYFRWWELPFWQFFLWLAARQSGHLVAVSEPTRRDLLAHYGIPSRRATTVWSGVDRHFFALRHDGPREPLLVCPSTTHPHKNHIRLLRAFRSLLPEVPEWRLVLTGVRGFAEAAIRGEIRRLDLEGRVTLSGWVERPLLYRLFQQAGAFVYPSEFEGFGMPVLEALAAGLPAACSSIEPLRTLAGEAALLFDPRDEGDIAAALRRLLLDADLRCRLCVAGPAQARRYTWQNTARHTLQILEACRAG